MDAVSIAFGIVIGFAGAWLIRGAGMSRMMERTVAALSADALRDNRQAVVELAEQVLHRERDGARSDLAQRQQAIDNTVKPVREMLEKLDGTIHSIERARTGSMSALGQQIESLQRSESDLQRETALLVRALRSPGTRGRWGEMHLQRVVELAGLQDRCDFVEQHSVDGVDGRIRPDMLINLAGGRQLVVDSKVPLDGYLASLEASTEVDRTEHLRQHAAHLRGHVKALSVKAYWDQFESAPEFVLLFLPGDNFLQAALEVDPALRDDAVRSRVHVVTPSTLLPLLHVVAHAWREQALADNAREISGLGADLHQRVSGLAEHWSKVGKHLSNSVEAYNKSVGTLESRVLVTARRLSELEAARITSGDIPAPQQVDVTPRAFQAPELVDAESHDVIDARHRVLTG